jgi:uncharacterized protein YkwD
MKKLFTLTTSAAISLILASCASNLAAPNKPSSAALSVSAEERVIAERVYALVNEQRELAGEKSMRGHYGLNVLAQKHSLHMGSSMSEANHFGSKNRAQYAELKYSIENLSEMTYVVYGGSDDPAADAIEAWESSESHLKHMHQTWDLAGVGVYKAFTGDIYITICMGAQPLGVPRGIRPIGWQ